MLTARKANLVQQWGNKGTLLIISDWDNNIGEYAAMTKLP